MLDMGDRAVYADCRQCACSSADRALVYGTRCREFESLQARSSPFNHEGVFVWLGYYSAGWKARNCGASPGTGELMNAPRLTTASRPPSDSIRRC